MISTRQLGIAIGLLALCLSSAAALSLDDALGYSVNGKACTESETIKQVKEAIIQVQNAYQVRTIVQTEIDILKEVRDLINKAKESIIRVDSGAVSFLQTSALTPLKDTSYNGIMKLVEVMAQTSDPVDKIALCEQIITAINEIVGINETLLAREDYDSIPTKLTSIVQSIDTFLANCAKPPEDNTGSVKIGTVDKDGKVIVDGGVTPEPSPTPTPTPTPTVPDTKTNDGSVSVGGNGSAQVTTPTVPDTKTSDGSVSVGGNGSAQVDSTTPATPTVPDTKTNDGSATVGGNGSAQVDSTTPATPTVPDTKTNDGSATVGGNGSAQVNPTTPPVTPTTIPDDGSIKINTTPAAETPNDGSIKIVDSSASKTSFVQTSEDASFVGAKLHPSKKSKKQRKQQPMGF